MVSALKEFDKQWIEEYTYVASVTKQGNGNTDPSTLCKNSLPVIFQGKCSNHLT